MSSSAKPSSLSHLFWMAQGMGAHKMWQIAKADTIEESISWYATLNCFRTDVADVLMGKVWQLRTDAVYEIETKSL